MASSGRVFKVRALDPLNSAVDAPGGRLEHPAYLDTPAGQIYRVVHAAEGARRGAALICGPIAAERERAYLTLVRWARTLAAQGVDVMRFDYRGIGESTGRFEEITITGWREDAALCAAHLAELAPEAPLVLHGVQLGAVIASELFASGVGDGLLLWAPPASARDLLWNTMRRDLVARMQALPDVPRRTREQQVAAIEAGELVNVDGYFWSRALWSNAQQHVFSAPSPVERRPWHVIDVTRVAAPAKGNAAPDEHREAVVADSFWENSELLLRQCDALFLASLKWLNGPGLTRGKQPK